MSVDTLYTSFKGSLDSSQDIDLLGSEIGTDLGGHLDTMPPVKTLLGGEDWEVTPTKVRRRRSEKVRQAPVRVPVLETVQGRTQVKRWDPFTDLSYTTSRVVTSSSVRIRKVSSYLDVVTGFTLDGTIGENVRFFGYFWDDQGTLKYYALFEFPGGFVDAFFEYAYWPERSDLGLTRPQVLVFSHRTGAFGATWSPGIYLKMDFAFGDNLEAAAGDHSPLHFGGPIAIKNQQPTFSFFSWPAVDLKFDGGKVTIERVQLFAGTQDWSDGEVPRTIEGDPEEEDADDGSPDPHEVQFSLQGFLKIKDDNKPKVWSPLPKDDGVIVWNITDGTKKLPSPKDLDALLGEQAWAKAFGKKWDNYILKELDLTAQLPDRSLSSASYTLSGVVVISGAAPSKLTINDAEIRCTILEPASESRQEIVEVSGTVTTDGATFEIHGSLTEHRLELSSVDGEGFDRWSRTAWYQLRLRSGGFENTDIEDVYDALHVEVDLKAKRFRASVTNEDGDEKQL